MPRSIEQDLIALRKRKREAEESGRKARKANIDFKQFQSKLLGRIESRAGVPEGSDPLDFSMKTAGTLFSVVQKIKGAVDDRARYVRWALENDEGVSNFIVRLMGLADTACYSQEEVDALIEEFIEAITSTELIEYKEKGDKLNQLVSTAIEDDEILPPGTTFRPDNYISQRAS